MQTIDTGCRFFRAAQEVFHGIGPCRVQEVYLVAAVIDDNVRMMIECFIEIAKVFFICAGMRCIDRQAIFNEGRGHIILRRQGIAARYDNLGTGTVQYFSQISRFCFEMNAYGNGFAFKRLVSL